MSTPQEEHSKWLVATSVSFYIVSALSLVMANKMVLKSSPIPVTFLWFQILISVILLALVRIMRIKSFTFKLPSALDWQITKGLAPLVCLNVVGLTFNTLTLALVDASFYQIARGLVLPLTVVSSLVFLKSRPTLFVILACTVITSGFFVGIVPFGSETETKTRGFTPLGILFGLTSCICTALQVVVVKSSLQLVQNSALDLAWYSNALTSIIMMPLIILIGEHSLAITWFGVASKAEMSTFITGTLITGFFGFLISVAGILTIKVTSPITTMVASAVRGVAQTLIGAYLFSELINVSRAVSVLVILSGSIWYTWIKHQESVAAKATASGGQYTPIPMQDRDVERGQRAQD